MVILILYYNFAFLSCILILDFFLLYSPVNCIQGLRLVAFAQQAQAQEVVQKLALVAQVCARVAGGN
jgi:hypothetical protein